jgi:hypothetical protein
MRSRPFINRELLGAKLCKLNPDDLISCATIGPGKHSGYTDYCVRPGTHCNTKTSGVIGLGAPEHCSGMAVVIESIEDTNIDILWTDGLAGCLAIAIIGLNEKTGKKDIFFSHASYWDTEDAATNKNNPIYYARQFVDSHGPCRILIGTDIEKLNRAGYNMAYAKCKLSKDLGCPVTCEAARHTLSFFPKLGIMQLGNPATAVNNLKRKNPKDLLRNIAESEEKFYSHPEHDRGLLVELQDAILDAKDTGCCCNWLFSRLFGQNEQSRKIVNYLESMNDAYIGNNLEEMEKIRSCLSGLKLNKHETEYLLLCNSLIQDRIQHGVHGPELTAHSNNIYQKGMIRSI